MDHLSSFFDKKGIYKTYCLNICYLLCIMYVCVYYICYVYMYLYYVFMYVFIIYVIFVNY